MRLLLPALALALVGCSHATPPSSTPPPSGAAACNAAAAQRRIGRRASPELGREAQRLAGAGTWRWLRPGQIVTMEYRADRLNLKLDAQDRVEAVTCG